MGWAWTAWAVASFLIVGAFILVTWMDWRLCARIDESWRMHDCPDRDARQIVHNAVRRALRDGESRHTV